MSGYNLSAQSGRLTGIISDSDTREVLSYAVVKLSKGAFEYGGTTADINGHFEMHPITPGFYKVKVSCQGYKPMVKEGVKIFEDSLVKVDFQLKKDASYIPGSGKDAITIPKKFYETVPPEYNSKEWQILNFSKDIGVENNNGKLEVKKFTKTQRCELAIPDGKLIGIDRGEFGGSLTFIPSDENKKSIEIIERVNLKFLFIKDDKICFIMDGGYSTSAIMELEQTDGNYTYHELVGFDDCIQAYTIYEDNILIATESKFFVVRNDFKKELIFENIFWDGLYPNSIAAFDDENVFVGIRRGIVKIDLTDRTLVFYKYD